MHKAMTYFKKDVNIFVNYMHVDGDKVPDTFSIYVTQKNKTHMLTNLEWNEVSRVISSLDSDDKLIQLSKSAGIGREFIDVPRWARKMLSLKLSKLKQKEDEDMNKSMVFEFSELAKHEEKSKKLLDGSLLIEGVSGSGKTSAIKRMIPELLDRGNRVVVIDFRDEYEDITEKHQGLSLMSDEAHRIDVEASLVRIHFAGDIIYGDESYNVDFLPNLASEFDYLIIDDTYLLHPSSHRLETSLQGSISGICSDLIQRNLNLKIILSFHCTTCLSEKDSESLKLLFPRQLLFRKILPGLDVCSLRYQKRGECTFFENGKMKLIIAFMKDN